MTEKEMNRPRKEAVAGFLVSLSQLGVGRELLSEALDSIAGQDGREWAVRKRWQRQPEPAAGMLVAYWQARRIAEDEDQPVYVVSRTRWVPDWGTDFIVQPWPVSRDVAELRKMHKEMDAMIKLFEVFKEEEKPKRRKAR